MRLFKITNDTFRQLYDVIRGRWGGKKEKENCLGINSPLDDGMRLSYRIYNTHSLFRLHGGWVGGTKFSGCRTGQNICFKMTTDKFVLNLPLKILGGCFSGNVIVHLKRTNKL